MRRLHVFTIILAVAHIGLSYTPATCDTPLFPLQPGSPYPTPCLFNTVEFYGSDWTFPLGYFAASGLLCCAIIYSSEARAYAIARRRIVEQQTT